VRDVTPDNFGLLIAYLLPGFVALRALRPLVPEVAVVFDVPAGAGPTVGGFLYGTLASVSAGLVVSAVRWAVVDWVYHRTGIPEPDWNFRKLPANLAAFESHVQDHYRYYQFYANMLVALAAGYALTLAARGWPVHWGRLDIGAVGLLTILVLGSRDSLRKYYRRTEALLSPPSGRRVSRIHGPA